MYSKKTNKKEIYQGDIFEELEYVRWANINPATKQVNLDIINIPYFVVLTQACDLSQDYNNRENQESEKQDKYIDSILVCPAYLASHVKAGTHLDEMGIDRHQFSTKEWNRIQTNQNLRYHFLKEDTELQIPELVIDFKSYYTVPRKVLYLCMKEKYLASLNDLFKEDVSQRFSAYLSRIGLP